jgi:hypothetical protein
MAFCCRRSRTFPPSGVDSPFGHLAKLFNDIDADKVSPKLLGYHSRRAGTDEGVQDDITSHCGRADTRIDEAFRKHGEVSATKLAQRH